MSGFKPIIRDLEHEDSDYRTSTLPGVDVTPHLLSAFPTTADAVASMNDESQFIEGLRVAFEEDPSLVNDEGVQHPWSLYEGDMRGILLDSLGHEHDDGSMSDEDVWETWSKAARANGSDARHQSAIRSSFETKVEALIVDYQKTLGDDTLATLASIVMAQDGGLDAIRVALARYEGEDALAALRLAGDLTNDPHR